MTARPRTTKEPPTPTGLPCALVRPQVGPAVTRRVLVAHLSRTAAAMAGRALARAGQRTGVVRLPFHGGALASQDVTLRLEIPGVSPVTNATRQMDIPGPSMTRTRRAMAGRHPGRVLGRDNANAVHTEAAAVDPMDTDNARKGVGGPSLPGQPRVRVRYGVCGAPVGPTGSIPAPGRVAYRPTRSKPGAASPVKITRVSGIVPAQLPSRVGSEVLTVAPEGPRTTGPHGPVTPSAAARADGGTKTATAGRNGEGGRARA